MRQVAKKAAASARRRRTGKPAHRVAGGKFSLTSLMDERGVVKIDDVAETFCMTKAQLADTSGHAREVFQKTSRRTGHKVQSRVREMLEIINLVQGWAGGPAQAMA